MNLKQLLNEKEPHNKKIYIPFLTKLFSDKKKAILTSKISKYIFLHPNTIFLILSNVKNPSPLARVKMRRNELFSKNEAFTRIS